MIFKALLLAVLLLRPLSAADLVVTISSITSTQGEIGCALFRSAAGFPMDASKAERVWVKPGSGTAECRFSHLSPGAYALAVSHDLNANRKTDTNFVGMPKEDWGVSNNVRPRLRAPRFDEARFEIQDGGPTRLEVRIAR